MSDRPDILLLGGSGPIGRAIRRAAAAGSVVSASRGGEIALDVRDTTAVENLVTEMRPRALVYLINDKGMTLDAAVAAFDGAVTAAIRGGVDRLVYASSAAVYGDLGGTPYFESSPLRGQSAYARTKARAEELLVVRGDRISGIALRVFNVFGEGCDGSLVNRLAFGPPPALVLSGGFIRDYVDVDDVASAFLAAIDHPAVHGAVNIGRGEGVDNLRLAATAGVAAYTVVEERDLWSYSVAEVGRARRELGWVPRIDPFEIIRGREWPER